MGGKQNRYLFTAGVLVFAFLFMPLAKFAVPNEVYTVLDFKVFMMSTGYKYYVGGVMSIILAALIFAAVTMYRSSIWQSRLIWAACLCNVLLFAFIMYKHFHWTHDPIVSVQQPSFQFGIVFPIMIHMNLLGALQVIRRMDE